MPTLIQQESNDREVALIAIKKKLRLGVYYIAVLNNVSNWSKVQPRDRVLDGSPFVFEEQF